MKINGSELNKSALWDLRRAIAFCRSSHSTPIPLARNKGRATIELIKRQAVPLGLTISGGADKDGKARIAQLKTDSIIHKADLFDIGDVLIGVNQIKTSGLKHEQVIELIKQSAEHIFFDIEYDLPKWPLHPPSSVHMRTIQLQLEKEGQSYGFVLRGGRTDDPHKTRPLIITRIRPQGPADKEGTIKIGDRVIAINGINVSQATLTEAYEIMKQCRGTTLFLIEYDVAIVESIKHATGPLLIEIEKSPGTSVGLTLTQKWTRASHSIIVIDSVKPASIADRCGALHCGDQINSIDHRSLIGASLASANAILRSCTGDFCRIEVTPANLVAALHHLIEPTPNRDLLADVTYAIPHRPSTQNTSQQWSMRNSQLNPIQKSIHKARHHSLNFTPMMTTSSSVMKMYNLREFSSFNPSYPSMLISPISHSETMECLLRFDSTMTHHEGDNGNAFGFTLQNHSLRSDVLLQAPIIGSIEPGGIAERSSILQIGDRVLAINGQILEGMTFEAVQQLIKEANPQLQLDIEFDVADSVMLSSGTCQVKILRKNLDLGLSVTYSRSSRTDEVPIISHVKRGSIAHRCGMIQTGDHLLSIDGHSLRGKSLHDIVSLLKNTDDIVQLKIKKDDNYSEDNLSGNNVVYKVQLLRQGGPLGLTISGSEDVFEPIVVSNLCEGGLAEKTNAIHVGDRILAINDVSLRGKGLHEAIELLQTSGDEITLKISRLLSPSQKDYTLSVDSAMESWDSSHAEPSITTPSDFLLKAPTTTTTHRSTLIIPDRRTPTQNLRYPDTIAVHLQRDKRVLDFGFSISDRLYGTGVYVNKIRPNGPAESEGSLIPQMRIYQVNEIDVSRMECGEVVPLLSSSADQLRLVVGRRPAPTFDETDEWLATSENNEIEETARKTLNTL